MTYCVGIMLDAGMVFASDSRTNAGVDNVASFRKMTIYERAGERVLVLLSAGNLSTTQITLNLLEKNIHATDGRENILTAPTMFDVANLVGEALRQTHQQEVTYLAQSNIDYSASFLLGGQINGENQRLFHIYAQGNFIEATHETSFFQIGETKYGKPILDRVIKPETELADAVKSVLVSFDSTMRSNISVGPPIDLLCYRRDSYQVLLQNHIKEDDPYFNLIRRQWGDGVRQVFSGLPNPPDLESMEN